ncbi:MAG: PH domain-containing protein [Chloroflexaceae bacterium]|nr:PH domain-containing protein [Chloroflexaceae bacterium]
MISKEGTTTPLRRLFGFRQRSKSPPDEFGRITAAAVLEEIGYLEGEKAMNLIYRHWIELFFIILPAIILLVISFSVAVFRSLGGTFLVYSPTAQGEVDIFNFLIAMVLLVIAFLWGFMHLDKKSDKRIISLLLYSGLFLAVIFVFRYMGWRLFYIDENAVPGFDIANVILASVAFLSALYIFYQYYEWGDDTLILTNLRVIQDRRHLFGDHATQQVMIGDIQNVTAITNTYVRHYLKYGDIVIKSATVGRDLTFKNASQPMAMQRVIMGVVNARRNEQSSSALRAMVEKRIYKNDVPATAAPAAAHTGKPKKRMFGAFQRREKPRKHRFVSTVPGVLRPFIPENPKVVEKDGQITEITWHYHWVFFLAAMAKPFAFLCIALVVLALAGFWLGLDAVWITFGVLVSLLIWFIWAAWEREDFSNDPYILQSSQVIDVDKKPFGPENRRSANLGQLQNVTYTTSFFGRWLGYGDVILNTAGKDSDLTFLRLPNPAIVVATINEFVADYKKGAEQRGLNNTLNLLHEYHNAQMAHDELQRQQEQQQATTPPVEHRQHWH